MDKTKKISISGILSITIAITTIVIIINEFIQIIPTHKTKLQGALILTPILSAPIGILFGLIPIYNNKNPLAKIGLILNITLILFIPLYHIIGTLIFGP